jgi:hypothetical protein
MNWLATLSIDPDLEVRRRTLSVFSELQAAYVSQKTLHELHFHLHDDKKLLETRIRGAMSDLGERLTKAVDLGERLTRRRKRFMSFIFIFTMIKSFLKREFVALCLTTGSEIQKRQNVVNQLKPICDLVEEMLEIAKRSYGVALTASHMGHIAFEHNVTILQLSQLSNLKQEIRSWVLRSSQDATAAMILAEENVVMAKVNQELRAQVQQLQENQRRQTEVLNGLLTMQRASSIDSDHTRN